MQRDLDLLLACDDVVVRHHVPLLGHDHTRALAARGIRPDAGASPEIVELLGAHARGVDADHRGHHGFG